MERMTEKRNGLNVIPLRRDGSPEWCVSQNQNDGTISVFGAAADTLAAYEDTGLEPSEIAEIQAENAKLRELLKLAMEDLKICSFQPCNYCEVCKYGKNDDLCPFLMCTIGANDSEFYWRHADEVEEILKEVQNA